MRAKRTKWATTALTVVAVLAGTAGAAAAAWKIQANEWLTDLNTSTTDGTEDARAHVTAEADGTSTHVSLKLEGLDHLAVGRTYGAHVHTGPCATDEPAGAGGHYKHDTAGTANPENEIWLDFTVDQGGVARSATDVPFVVPEGAAQSVVVHTLATNPTTGAAGARIACIPVEF